MPPSALVKILPSYDFGEGSLINLEFGSQWHCGGYNLVYRGSEAPLLIVVVTLGNFFVRFQLSEKALIEGGGVIAWLGVRAQALAE